MTTYTVNTNTGGAGSSQSVLFDGVAGANNTTRMNTALTALINANGLRVNGWENGTTHASCGLTNSSTTVTDANATESMRGMYVKATGIPALTYIVSVVDGVSFTMSAGATATATRGVQVGFPVGTIQAPAGWFRMDSPCANFGPFVTLRGQGKAATVFEFRGVGACFSWLSGSASVGSTATGTMLFDALTIDGFNAATTSGRLDTCTLERGSTTVLDASITSDDVGKQVFGPGVSTLGPGIWDVVTIASVVPGVSFQLSYKAWRDRVGQLQIGGERNVGAFVGGVECAKIGPDTEIRMFKRIGSVGLMVTSGDFEQVNWAEKLDIIGLTLSGNNTQLLSCWGSRLYSVWDIIIFGGFQTEENVVFDGSGMAQCRLFVRGNLYVDTDQEERVLSIVGIVVDAGQIRDSTVSLEFEQHGSTENIQAVYIGPTSGNQFTNIHNGVIKAGYGGNVTIPCNGVLGDNLSFEGWVQNDSTLYAGDDFAHVEVGFS